MPLHRAWMDGELVTDGGENTVSPAEAFGQWIERHDERLSTVEDKTDSLDRVLDDAIDDVSDIEESVQDLEEQLAVHKRAEFIDSVVSAFDENGGLVTDFKLTDKDGAFLQGGGVELTIHAVAKDGDSDV